MNVPNPWLGMNFQEQMPREQKSKEQTPREEKSKEQTSLQPKKLIKGSRELDKKHPSVNVYL